MTATLEQPETAALRQQRPTELVWSEHPLIDRIEGGRFGKRPSLL